jgi:autotransporter-associated beta strand protein
MFTRILSITIWMLSIEALHAGSATWAPTPVSGDWDASANWVPMTIPNGPADTATFETSTQTNISIGGLHEMAGMTFNPGASAYVITADATADYVYLTISGEGIINNSGRVQNLVADPNSAFNIAYIVFGNSASAGSGTQITNRGGTSGVSNTQFNQASSAGSATIINASGLAPDGRGGTTTFAETASAGTATIINEGGGNGGSVLFLNNSSAANSTITNHGATGPGPFGGGETRFIENSSAGDATLIANGGTNGGNGGSIRFNEVSTGGTARVEIFGNGRLDQREHYLPGVTIGSLAGSGVVFTGLHSFTVGSNNESTTFSGMIRGGDEGGITGGLNKIGTGTLTLSGTGSFASSVRINAGKLEMTGSFLYAYYYVNEGGTLAGSGTIWNLFVNRLGVVAPGHQRTLHIDGSYEQYAGGVLRIEVAGTEPDASDHLEIKSTARLDGTLEVRFVNGFLPASGQVFKIFTAGFGQTGSFARIVFPDLRAGFQFQPEFVNNTYQITALNDGVPATGLLNISTRMRVGTGDNALIGGFIITGNAPKRVILRAIGPSLTGGGTSLPGRLADPTLELRGPAGELISFNDNWMESAQVDEIIDTGIPPADEHEAAIIATLEPGNYTAIMRGLNNTTGIGTVEAYDLTQGALARLDNISSRGFVESGDNVMIGGFITDNQATHVMVRALGPSLLTQFGIPDTLADPTLSLHDAQGAMIGFNNDWRDADQTTIEATGIPPSNEKESAILTTLAPGGYTAIVRGQNNMTGVGLVEVYNLH